MKLQDDGTTVTLDVHGASVSEAENVIRTTTRIAAARGRSSLRVIHGASTSGGSYRNKTIKNVLEELLNRGSIPNVTDHIQMDGVTLISLRASGKRDSRKISLFDVR